MSFSIHKAFAAIWIAILVAGCSSGPAWVRGADLPINVSWLSTTVLDGKIYVLGGFEQDTGSQLGSTKVAVYDPAADTWTAKADMLTGRGKLALETVGGKIYAIGGSPQAAYPPMATVEVYDPAANSWSSLPDMLEALDGGTAIQVGGKIFILGGTTFNSFTQEKISLSSVEEFDPQTNTWTKKAEMPTPRYALSAVVINGKIYAIGGMISTFQMVTPEYATQAVEVYDPQTDTWAKKADIPAPRAGAPAAVLNGKIYVFGGTDIDYRPATSTIFEYDPNSDTWTTALPMPFNRLAMSASVINGLVYIVGGSAQGFLENPPDLSVWEFRP